MITNKYSIINGEDTLNLQRRRNYRNTEKYEYNCGGYALENYAWYLPYSEDQRWDMSIYESSEDSDDLAIKMVSHMLKDYKGRMRKINDVKELRQGEYAIAFRASKWHGDFHYAKLGKNGVWYHKMGGSERIRVMSKEEVFGSSWCCGLYDSKVHLLALKRI